MLYDLSIPWSATTRPSDLQRTLSFSSILGYDSIALDYLQTSPVPSQITNPIPQPLPFKLPPKTNVLRRCTVVFTEPSQNYRLPSLASAYDILALRPTTEKAFLAACTSIQEHSIISLDLTNRFGFHFRPKPLMAAVNRGIRFEICYAQATEKGETARRNIICNCMGLFRVTGGRGLILSSGTSHALGLRGPADVVNLMGVWGLKRDRALEALGMNPRGVIVNEGLKRTSFRGVIDIIEGGKVDTHPDEDRIKPGQTAPKNGKENSKSKRKFDNVDKNDLPPLSKRQAKKIRLAQKAAPSPVTDSVNQSPQDQEAPKATSDSSMLDTNTPKSNP